MALLVGGIGQAKADGGKQRCGAPEQHYVKRGKAHFGGGLRVKLGVDFLLRLQQVFGHGQHECVAQTFGQQQAGYALGGVVGAGEYE